MTIPTGSTIPFGICYIHGGADACSPKNVLGISTPPSFGIRKGAEVDYIKKLKQIDNHLAEHPKDYQSVIARMKTYSAAVDHEIHERRVARMKKVMKYMKGEDNGSK